MGIVYFIIWLVYTVFALIVCCLVKKFIKTNCLVILTALVLILFPFRRMIFYKIIFSFYCRSPLQVIHETIESPESVYWEDNVLSGWDEHGRKWMVEQYLDGTHLKILAMNGKDSKIYLYRAGKNSFKGSEELFPAYDEVVRELKELKNKAKEIARNGENNKALWKEIRAKEKVFSKGISQHYREQKQKELNQIMGNVEIYEGNSSLPTMNYRVELNFMPTTFFVNNDCKILYADRISIVDVKHQNEIAFSKRYKAYSGAFSQFPFDYKLGKIGGYEFDDIVLFNYADDGGHDLSRERVLEKKLSGVRG